MYLKRQADIAEASDIIENDLHDRGVTNQDRIVNNFKAKTIANEVSKLHDGKIKVDGDIRTDKISRRVQAFYDSKGLETVWFKNSYVKDKNGNFTKAQINGFTNGNKIYLNSDVPIERQIFKHEYHHTLENAKGFENYSKRLENSKAFKEWILNKAKKLNATGTYNNQYKAVLNEYIRKQKKVKNLSNTQARNEAFADFMTESLFSGKNFNETMNKLQEAFEDKNAFQKFIDTIKDILSRIKEALGGSASIEALERNIVKLQKQIDSGKTVQNKNTDNGVKYMYTGEKSQTADKLKLETAKEMEKQGVDSETIRKETGWFKGKDGLWRFRIADNEMKLYFNKLSEEPIALGECVKHDKLFAAYPQLKDFSVRLVKNKENLKGQFNGKEIIIKSSLSPMQKKRTLIHEIQHYIQSVENFARGGNRKLGICYAINDAYSEAIKQSEYKKLKTPDERLDFTFSLAEKRFNVKGIKNVSFEAYRNLYGEVEARETSDLMNFNEEFLKYIMPNTSGKVANKSNEVRKFVDNLKKMGYTENEIKDLFRGVENDESRSNRTPERGHTRTRYDRLSRFISVSGLGTSRVTKTTERTSGSNRRGISSDLRISNSKAGLNNNSAFSIDEDSSDDIRYMLDEDNADGNETHKQKQLDIVLKNNAANDDYHTWIRTKDDILTFEEALQDSDNDGWEDDGFTPDYDGEMAKQALKTGKITVYSSYPIKQGVFVTPSRMEAESYAGKGKIYESTVNLTDVAWIDATQGQYARVDNSVKFSVDDEVKQSARDNQYLSAVENGDTETAQRLVDEAAKATGYTIKAYHGTTNQEEKSVWNSKTRTYDTSYTPIRVFKKQYDEQVGHFFNDDIDNAGGYGSYLYSVYLKIDNPLIIDCNGQNYSAISFDGKEMDTYEWADYAKKKRYDGVIFKNISDGVDYDDLSKLTTDYVVFNSNQIKSADPVTYDDNGNVIPLSERFNEDENDIRYMLDEENFDENGDYFDIDEDGEVSYIKNEEYQKRLKKNPKLAVLDKQQIELKAKAILKNYQSRMDSADVASQLLAIYNDIKNIDENGNENYTIFWAEKNQTKMPFFTIHRLNKLYTKNTLEKKNPMMIYIGQHEGNTYAIEYGEIQDENQQKEFADILNKYIANILPFFEYIQ